MQWNRWALAFGLTVVAAWPARGEITDGVMAVRGCEMS